MDTGVTRVERATEAHVYGAYSVTSATEWVFVMEM